MKIPDFAGQTRRPRFHDRVVQKISFRICWNGQVNTE